MSAATATAPRALAAARTKPLAVRAADFLLLADLFTVTFEKIHWNVAANVAISDILTILFAIAFVWARGWRPTRPVAAVMLFFAAFLLVYLLGFFNLDTKQSLDQFGKGMGKFVLHFVFLACAVSYLAKRGRRFYLRALALFTLGLVANGVYGILQLLAARAGTNLDTLVLSPLTGGASSINIYGAVNGQSVYRPNALTGDPNHLGIMLEVPLLALTPVYLRLARRSRLRLPLGLTLAFLLVIELATLSRSGILGLGVGALVLLVPYRRFLASRALLAPLAGVVVLLAAVVWERRHYFSVVIRSRLQTGGGSSNAHLAVYSFIPQIVHSHPLLGLGFNSFSVYYGFVTGKTNWGPHSFYVALIVETGLVGALVFAAFLLYLFARLRAGRRLGARLAALRDPAGRTVRPLAWGLTAALAGTMAANLFYLTMTFYYFYALAAFALALPAAFGRRAA